MTEPGGPAWRQTIFHPFAQASRFGHGEVLRTRIQADSYRTATHPRLDYLLASIVHDPATGRATLFALNRNVTDEIQLEVELRGLGKRRLVLATQMHHADLKATNTRSAPRAVEPTEQATASTSGDRLKATLVPLSWNVFVTEPG